MSQEREKLKQRHEKEDISDKIDEKTTVLNDRVEPKYGPLPTFKYQKVWSRCVLILGVLLIVWYNSTRGKEVALARQKEVLLSRTQNFECSQNYRDVLNKYHDCIPEKCGRVITDKLISATEVEVLLKLAVNGINLGDSDDGASILDLHSGALSKGTSFTNVYSLDAATKIFNPPDFAIYKVVKTKIHHAIAHHFGVDAGKIYLTKPTFFSRMTNASAESMHDEYLMSHIHGVSNEHFHYTSLLYLSDYDRDFHGGKFIFIDKNNVNSTIEPRKGRVLMFTSGDDNYHAVQRVTYGTRYALTVSFTCDIEAAISDPTFGKSVKYP